MARKVAIIGAGCSGLAAIKCCIEEGLDPTCFEKSDGIGGLWRYSEKVEEDRASLYKSVFTNTSKEMMCYSDFPMPEDFPVYPHHSKILEYLILYAEKFNLTKYIQFQTKVCSVKPHSSFANTGQWTIEIERDGKRNIVIFDAVFICNGHYNDPYMPLYCFPGIENFKGGYIHSKFYKSSEKYREKTVVVVGSGSSAGDISVELSHIAKQVFLSTRNGSWVVSRLSRGGFPIDMTMSRRVTMWFKNLLPNVLAAKMTEKIMSSWFDHSNFGLEPKLRLKHPMVNDYLPSQILQGVVKVKPGITSFSETYITFEDGTSIEVDEVVFATGYSLSFPFLDDVLHKPNDTDVSLYKYVFPTHLEKPTIAFLGLVQPLGPIMPTVELQARWATRVFKGMCKGYRNAGLIAILYLRMMIGTTYFATERTSCSLESCQGSQIKDLRLLSIQRLSQRHGWRQIVKSKEQKNKWFGIGKTQVLQMHYIDYINEVSKEIGIHPNLPYLYLTDPKLALQVFFGPCTPYQMRLTGPGKWFGARQAILTQWDRTIKPTKTRILHKQPQSGKDFTKILIVGVLMTVLWLDLKFAVVDLNLYCPFNGLSLGIPCYVMPYMAM
ncbi:dimethylaniline monooxygenase [N-oxide-forming] 2-like [Gastrophryne carolinensis]